mgnify:CR=1 FL=1
MTSLQLSLARYGIGSLLGSIPLFLAFVGFVFMQDLISTSGGATRPVVGLWSFTIGMLVVFLGYSTFFIGSYLKDSTMRARLAYFALVLISGALLLCILQSVLK